MLNWQHIHTSWVSAVSRKALRPQTGVMVDTSCSASFQHPTTKESERWDTTNRHPADSAVASTLPLAERATPPPPPQPAWITSHQLCSRLLNAPQPKHLPAPPLAWSRCTEPCRRCSSTETRPSVLSVDSGANVPPEHDFLNSRGKQRRPALKQQCHHNCSPEHWCLKGKSQRFTGTVLTQLQGRFIFKFEWISYSLLYLMDVCWLQGEEF